MNENDMLEYGDKTIESCRGVFSSEHLKKSDILDYNKNAQKNVLLASKVDEGKSVPKKTIVERNIEESVKLRRRRRRRRKKHKQ